MQWNVLISQSEPNKQHPPPLWRSSDSASPARYPVTWSLWLRLRGHLHQTRSAGVSWWTDHLYHGHLSPQYWSCKTKGKKETQTWRCQLIYQSDHPLLIEWLPSLHQFWWHIKSTVQVVVDWEQIHRKSSQKLNKHNFKALNRPLHTTTLKASDSLYNTKAQKGSMDQQMNWLNWKKTWVHLVLFIALFLMGDPQYSLGWKRIRSCSHATIRVHNQKCKNHWCCWLSIKI